MADHEPRWYDEIPERGLWRAHRRERIEFAIAAVLLMTLIGLLALGVSRKPPQGPRPAPVSPSGVTAPVGGSAG